MRAVLRAGATAVGHERGGGVAQHVRQEGAVGVDVRARPAEDADARRAQLALEEVARARVAARAERCCAPAAERGGRASCGCFVPCAEVRGEERQPQVENVLLVGVGRGRVGDCGGVHVRGCYHTCLCLCFRDRRRWRRWRR